MSITSNSASRAVRRALDQAAAYPKGREQYDFVHSALTLAEDYGLDETAEDIRELMVTLGYTELDD